jgi:1,4-dihydroxy-2-naphthoyl-CoA hydrolase
MVEKNKVLEIIKQTSQHNVMKTLGIEIVSAEKDLVVLSMNVEPKVYQYSGVLHGGVSLVIAESAAGIGAVLNSDLTKVTPVGIEINANHLRSVSKGRVTAEARPLYHGRTLSVWEILIKDDRQRLVCVSRCSIALRKGGVIIE